MCLSQGGSKGLRTSLWLIRIIVPISLIVTLLDYFGVLAWMAPYLQPLFRHFGLPGQAVVACISGGLLSVYSGIAALSAIPLTQRQLTILAVMILTAHNVPVESIIQHKAGTSLWRMAILRIAVSFASAFVLNLILPAGDPTPVLRGPTAAAMAFWPLMLDWLLRTGQLMGMICLIVVSLMILQQVLKEFKLMDLLAIPLVPLLWVLGLPRRMAFLWIVGNVVGLAYGSAIILEEVDNGALNRKDAQLLNRSLAMCHSLLEDTLLFVAIGAWPLWITMPRLALAALVVWVYRAVTAVWKRPAAA